MRIKKLLQWVMLLSGVVTACNCITLNFDMIFIPSINLSVVLITFWGYLEKNYVCFLISFLLIALILLGATRIKRNSLLWPTVSGVIYLGDVAYAGFLLISDWFVDGVFFDAAAWSILMDMIVITLLVLYYVDCIKKKKENVGGDG